MAVKFANWNEGNRPSFRDVEAQAQGNFKPSENQPVRPALSKVRPDITSNEQEFKQTPEFAQQVEDNAHKQAFVKSHPGLTQDFASRIAEILQQGKRAEQMYRDRADGNLTPKTMGEIAQQRMSQIPEDQTWRRQNPFTPEMGYQWADDDKLKSLGWGDDDITSMKSRTEFEPQEISNLYNSGALRAPYAEYLKEQERLRQEAAAAAAKAYENQSYYSGDEYYDGGYYEDDNNYSYQPEATNVNSTPAPATKAPEAVSQASAPTNGKSWLHRPIAEMLPDFFASNPAYPHDVYGM